MQNLSQLSISHADHPSRTRHPPSASPKGLNQYQTSTQGISPPNLDDLREMIKTNSIAIFKSLLTKNKLVEPPIGFETLVGSFYYTSTMVQRLNYGSGYEQM